MDTRGNIHELPDDPLLVKELERKVGALVAIPKKELPAVQAMSLAERLAWRSRQEAKTLAALPEDERRKQRNAKRRERRARR